MQSISCKNSFSSYFFAAVLIISSGLLRCAYENEEIRTKTNSKNFKNSSSTFIYNVIPEEGQAQISSEYSTAVNTFSVNLLDKIYNDDLYNGKNIVASPCCISRNLAIITEAATGETQQELLNALEGRAALDDANSALKTLLYADKSILLLIADAIWLDSNDYTLVPAFRDTANKKYGIEVTGLNFDDVDASVKVMNKWIAGNTCNKITDAVKKKYFGDYTALFITSTIYFEADWTSPFDVTKTESHPFVTPSGSVDVQMMTSSYLHKTRKTDEYENARIYYGTSQKDFFYLDIYMPAGISIEDFIGQKCLSALESTCSFDFGQLKMPKFFFENEIDLKPVLQNMGINGAFDQDKLEINGIAIDKATQNNEGLYIETIMHTAGIKMDEEGTVAYAVTSSGMGTGSSDFSPDVVIDRPFVYFIRAGATGLVLFSGVVNNPGF